MSAIIGTLYFLGDGAVSPTPHQHQRKNQADGSCSSTMRMKLLLALIFASLLSPGHSFQCTQTYHSLCGSSSRSCSPSIQRRPHQNCHPLLVPTAKRKFQQNIVKHGQPHPCKHVMSSTQLSMCQLMGMNCAALTDFTFSFRGFARRGGDTDVHSHGWGLCFYDGRGLRAFHDPDPACESLLAEFLQTHPVKTLNMVSHIRYVF